MMAGITVMSLTNALDQTYFLQSLPEVLYYTTVTQTFHRSCPVMVALENQPKNEVFGGETIRILEEGIACTFKLR